MAGMARAMAQLRVNPPQTLAGQPLETVEDYLSGRNGLPPSDVLCYRNALGKAIVRPSGTEPKVKVYLSAPGASLEQAQAVLDAMEADARGWLASAGTCK